MSDVTLRDLPAEGTFLAMQKEIRGLTAVGAGQVLAENVARESGQRIIGTRWVTNEKEEAQEGVRARIVAKDFASGPSARSMGISSPTPSIEALRMVLGVACGAWSVGNQAMFLAGLDVSQAFMNSPLERPEILRMPLSMSTMKGEPIFLWAEKGINGLRICVSGMDRFLFIYCQEHWSSFRYCGALFVCWSNGWQRSGTHRHHGVRR